MTVADRAHAAHARRQLAAALYQIVNARRKDSKMTYKPTVLVDFDGVIHTYSRGWHDGTAYDVPMAGARRALADMDADGYEVVIFSTRNGNDIADWLQRWGFPAYRVTNVKEPAVAQIDDRAIRFADWEQAAAELRERYAIRQAAR